MVVVVRLAVMVCCCLLALPYGWCCILASFVPTATPTATVCGATVNSSTTGGCCPCRSPKPISQPTDKPTNPSAPTNTTCPCIDRHATPPETTAVEQVDAGFVLFLPPSPDVAPGVVHWAAVAETGLPPPVPRTHVLNCVWLC